MKQINRLNMKSKFAYLMLSASLFSCGGGMKIPEASIEYAVISVGTTTSNLNIAYPATIKGKQDIDIRPQVSGFITKVCVEEGQTVKTGQTLFIIDRVQYEAAVKSAQAAVRVAQANVNTQKLTVDNKKELNKKQIISNYDLEMAQNLLSSYEAQLAQAQAQLTTAKHNLSYTTVISPSSGIVGNIPYRIGALVNASSASPLTTISEISQMYVYFSMTEKQLLEMTRESGNVQAAISRMPGVQLQLADGSIYNMPGKIETASGMIDQSTGSVSMRATFQNPNRILRSGGTGQILIPSNNSVAISVPQKATFEIQDKKFVYVVDNASKVKAKEITVDSQNDGTNYIVTKGLNVGERIVVDGVSTLKNDMQIKPITPAQADAIRRKAEKESAANK